MTNREKFEAEMTDRDRVIKGLERCIALDGGAMRRSCESCPYNDNREEGTCISIIPLMEDALALLKAYQAYLLGVMYALQLIVDDAYLYDEPIAGDKVRRLIDQIRNAASHWEPEEHYDRDCRDCVEWETCPVGKGAHERGASIGYSAGECPDFEFLKAEAKE